MKRLMGLILIILLLVISLTGCSGNRNYNNDNYPDTNLDTDTNQDNNLDDTNPDNNMNINLSTHLNTNQLNGVWVCSVWNLDFPKKPTKNADLLKKEIDEITVKTKSLGLNTIFFQIKPDAGVLYKSNILPWSRFLTGTQGVAPEMNFDPLEYFITKARENGLKLHAWINPYRLTTQSTEILLPTHIANSDNELILRDSNNLSFLNPGVPKTREILVKLVQEVLDNYAVDGIHFDDYFYPNASYDDSSAYQKYNPLNLDLFNWRVANNTSLVKEVHKICKTYSSVFGLSPSGIWANNYSHPLGSATRGFESLFAIYADTRAWVKDGILDYIAPQIYWYIGQPYQDYQIVLDWWNEVCRNTDVALIPGIALYKLFDESQPQPWQVYDEIFSQIKLNKKSPACTGQIFFRYTDLIDKFGF